jgi:hypothetical protein
LRPGSTYAPAACGRLRRRSDRDEYLFAVKGAPLLKNLEGDPRYNAFLRKMNLPE